MSEFIHTEFGIKMPPSKKVMLQARLQKRLRALEMKSFGEYCSFIFTPKGAEQELHHMIDVVTTNKTDFFREPAHFDYLSRTAVPEMMKRHGAWLTRPLRIWSAGCSTGEEPYTLAIVLSEFAELTGGLLFSILATDISTRVLELAIRGIYEEGRVSTVPFFLRKKYLLRGKNSSQGLVRMIPRLRNLVEFRRLNFMRDDFGLREQMDIIFCRNVIIYFDRNTQEALIRRFCCQLSPAGYLFMGHSETLNGMDLPLVSVAPTVYRKIC